MDFSKLFALASRKHSHGQRWGQAYFNALAALDFELAERIRATALDPYYNDERIPDFLERVGNAARSMDS